MLAAVFRCDRKAAELLRRVLGPRHASQLVVDAPAAQPAGAMGIGSRGGKVLLQGSTGVEVASALNWYLNDYANTTFSPPLPPLVPTTSSHPTGLLHGAVVSQLRLWFGFVLAATRAFSGLFVALALATPLQQSSFVSPLTGAHQAKAWGTARKRTCRTRTNS